MPALRAVFFDVDGVLLDSLPQHLAFCKMKANQYGLLEIQIPSIPEFRKLVTSGIPVSPMINFFLAVGFPPRLATEAVRDYEKEFAALFSPEPFPGVSDMLSRLSSAEFSLGLVTSNVKKNVEIPLSQFMHFFDDRCRFYFNPSGSDKRGNLIRGAEVLELRPSSCVFVGDQPADAAAAHAAHFSFLGVAYGWGLSRGTSTEAMVDSVSEIAPAIIAARIE
jgi:phosphoglycolate phosphatase-like HAD superfamily hydrolase